jgi:flagellar basal-body rod protein FlgC
MQDPALQGTFQGFDIIAAGLRAELAHADVVAANIGNMHVTGGKGKDPYRRKSVVFEEVLGEATAATRGLDGASSLAGGVRVKGIAEDRTTPFVPRYDPADPNADESGFVLMSNVDLFRELVDMSVVERSFQANLAALRAYRGMLQESVSNMRT